MFLVFLRQLKLLAALIFCTFGGYAIRILCGGFLMDIKSREMRPADTKISLNSLILCMHFILSIEPAEWM